VSDSASKGHLNPLIGVAQHVLRAGDQAGWMSVPRAMGRDDAAQVRAAGVTVLPTPPIPQTAIKSGSELSRLALDPERAWEAYRSFMLDAAPHLVDAICDAIRAFAPEAIATDCMAYPGIIAAHRVGVAYLGVCAGLKILKAGPFRPAYMNDMSPLIPLRRALFQRYGMDPEFRLMECLSPFGNVVFTTREFVGDIELSPKTHLVGPSNQPQGAWRGDESGFPWRWLRREGPIIYAAFGSVHTKDRLEDIIGPLRAATKRLGGQLVVSSEANAATSNGDAPQIGQAAKPDLQDECDCLVVPYAPQRKLLERVDAFVTHGGANSVMEALAAGVPLLIVPLSNDQPWQAHLATRRGVGIHVERHAFNIESCTEALARLIVPQSEFRRNAAEVQQSYRRQDGAAEAARLLLHLAT
jgi:UDP:flavonoid glycosyltransferase YjiC (YdhE family)